MTNLKIIREHVGFSQKRLASAAEISLRTLQDYEQGRRDINGASALTVFRLACALTNASDGVGYRVEDLLELQR